MDAGSQRDDETNKAKVKYSDRYSNCIVHIIYSYLTSVFCINSCLKKLFQPNCKMCIAYARLASFLSPNST